MTVARAPRGSPKPARALGRQGRAARAHGRFGEEAARGAEESQVEPAVPRPNWFFAFPLDGAFLSGLPEPPPSIRRYQPDDVHMTLAFLGGCGEPAALRALAVLDERLRRVLRHRFSTCRSAPSCRSGAPRAAIRRFRRSSTAAATSRPAPRADARRSSRGRDRVASERPAKPHVTLARVRARASAENREGGLRGRLARPHAVHARLDRIALYTWNEMQAREAVSNRCRNGGSVDASDPMQPLSPAQALGAVRMSAFAELQFRRKVRRSEARRTSRRAGASSMKIRRGGSFARSCVSPGSSSRSKSS